MFLNAAVILLTAGVAVAGALPYAVGWNDGSRLATVESLVDHGTLAIDRSVFVHPDLAQAAGGAPFGPGSLPAGTADKVFVNGRFYSDKAPVPAVAMSALYWGLQRGTGLVARERVSRFAYLMTVTTSGASYVAAAAGMFLLALRILGSARAAFVVALSFAFATITPVYSRAVNIHIVLLALATGVAVEWHRLVTCAGLGAGTGVGPDTRVGPTRVRPSTRDPRAAASTRDLLVLGALGGAAYACDFGIGPHLLGVSVLLAWWICRRIGSALLVVAGAAPLLILHHVLNYQVGGTLGPVGAVPEYLAWSGSPFASYELTGGLHHASARALLRYAVDLLIGARGFVRFNLPLLLLAPALPILFHARTEAPGVARRRGRVCVHVQHVVHVCGALDQLRGPIRLHPLVRSVACTRLSGRCDPAARAALCVAALPGVHRVGMRRGGGALSDRPMGLRSGRPDGVGCGWRRRRCGARRQHDDDCEWQDVTTAGAQSTMNGCRCR